MSSIQIKRGYGEPSKELLEGELGFNKLNNKLYIGTEQDSYELFGPTAEILDYKDYKALDESEINENTIYFCTDEFDEILTKDNAFELLGITATKDELNILDGVNVSTIELNYLNGVTSNIQIQLNNKSPLSHTHDTSDIISGALSISRGGTGQTTIPNTLKSYFPNSLTTGSVALLGNGWDNNGYISVANLMLKAFPIGAIYISYTSTSPASLFGGTWVAITGRFLYCNAGTATGGSNTHTLTTAQMPSHTHLNHTSLVIWTADGVTAFNKLGATGGTYTNIYWGMNKGVLTSHPATYSTGGGSAHNNMPAYQTVYAWRRTA